MPRRADNEVPVAIVGAGPVGLSLALGLARQGIRSLVLERDAALSSTSKAPGLHIRTREAFQQWGVDHRFGSAGTRRWAMSMHAEPSGRARPLMSIDLTDLDAEADDPGVVILEQSETERILFEEVTASGLAEVWFDSEVTDVDEDDAGAWVTAVGPSGSTTLRADHLVGCDGASSTVREQLGVGFDGHTYDVRPLLADVRIVDARDRLPWPQVRHRPDGLLFGLRLREQLWRVVLVDTDGPTDPRDPSSQDLAPLVEDLLGAGPFDVEWASRFTIHRRVAGSYRVGRCFLAGDAAQVHSPVGGQGMNGGILDAHNLAWKLAHSLRGGRSPLLESYDVERRRSVATSTGRYTDVLTRVFLQAPPGLRSLAMRAVDLLGHLGPIRRAQLRRVSMLDLGYGDSPILVGSGTGCVGQRVPNVRLSCPESDLVRLHERLPYRPVVVDLTERGVTGLERHVPHVRIGPDGHHDDARRLAGLVGGTGWMLVRPDAHVAAVGTDPPEDPAALLECTMGTSDPRALVEHPVSRAAVIEAMRGPRAGAARSPASPR